MFQNINAVKYQDWFRNDTKYEHSFIKLVDLLWHFSPPERIIIWDSIQLSKIYAPLKRSRHYKTHLRLITPKVLTVYLQIDY